MTEYAAAYPKQREILTDLFLAYRNAYERRQMAEGVDRRLIGLSDARFANMIGVTASSWSQYVNGQYRPQVKTVRRLGKLVQEYLGREREVEFYQAVEMPELARMWEINDPRLEYIVSVFENQLDDKVRRKIYELAVEGSNKAGITRTGEDGA